MYQIEKGIPVPNLGRKRKYPFAEMEIGDSFLVPMGDGKNVNSLRISIRNLARFLAPKRFAISIQEGGLRVWRRE
jgi:hypothetical protein